MTELLHNFWFAMYIKLKNKLNNNNNNYNNTTTKILNLKPRWKQLEYTEDWFIFVGF